MPKKRKTRRQKEKAKDRRYSQYKSIFDKISDSHDDNIDSVTTKEQIIIGNESPTPGVVKDNIFIKKDLTNILLLIILFIIIITVIYILDQRYDLLQLWANNLITILTK